MKQKFILYSLGFFLLASCTKDMTAKLNNNTKSPEIATGEGLFTNAQKAFTDQITTPNVNSGIFELVVQYWAETSYPQESQFRLAERNIPGNWWNTYYRNVIMNLKQAEGIIGSAKGLGVDPVTQKNKLAVCEIFRAYAYSVLVNTFGNIPYAEALNPDNSTPKYDDQKTIFYTLIDSLDQAISRIDPNGESFGSADVIYRGNVTQWVKFANSLKLRLGLLLSDSDPAKAKTVVEAAVAGGVFTSNADNAAFKYLSAPPNTNPIWTNLVQSGRKDFVATSYFIDMLKGLNDPRLPLYFTKDSRGGYSGGIAGNGNSYKSFSHCATAITAPDFPALLLDYAEVEFGLAEAVERGMNVGGTAMGHYNNAITAALQYWGVSATDINTYLLSPGVNYLTATGNWKQKIGTQAYIALYLRGFDAWTEWRKMDFPALVKPDAAISVIPLRYTYPSTEATLNGANFRQAGTAIGGDNVGTRLFWDKQ